MNRETLEKIQKAIREEGLDGWLFCNFRHRDALADELLERPASLTNSRLWLYAVPASGGPLAIVHAIEADHLDGLPAGETFGYVSRAELLERLAGLAGKRWGVHSSENISAVSYMDAGVAAMLTRAGLILAGAEGLIQRFKSLLDRGQIESHERAAVGLYEIVEAVWDFVRAAHAEGRRLYEGDLRQIMEDGLKRRALFRDHAPQAAAGKNSANPHYDFSGQGCPVEAGDVIQLDLWAREAGGVYADISWAGYYGKEPPEALETVFAAAAEARESALAFIGGRLAGNIPVTGAEVDRHTRGVLIKSGYGNAIKHRTGHGIDTEVHGSGVNMDGVEFPDTRRLLEGSCFSLEPGIYLAGHGFRTEIDVYIREGRAVVSGGGHKAQCPQTGRAIEGRQFTLLHC
ncbi:MAG: M24 family metallopeptidase [Treponema sp.]|jgi:Xaa-Pro aminopeptidase|nr:M24 family metallopeptidase [Treponema sp.]